MGKSIEKSVSKIIDDLGIYYKIGLTTDLQGSCLMRCIAG